MLNKKQMELVERLPLRPIQWLSRLNYADFISFCLNKEKQYTTDDCKQKYSLLQHFCKINLQNNGITKRIYSYSAEVCGRLFSGGSLQGMPCKIRGLLMCNGIGTDIDMTNAHPVILRYICKLHDIQCPWLDYYINNREECLSIFESRLVGKNMFLKSLNKDSRCRSSDLPSQYKLYDVEIKEIQKQIVKIKTYSDIVESVPHTKTYNKLGSAVNRILCYYENIILQHAIDFITSKKIEIAALMFDGLMIYGNYYSDKKLLEDITDHVESQMSGLNMKWTYKEHSSELRVPDDFVFIENPCKPERMFEFIAEEFEKTHLKIVNKSLFVKHANNNILFLTQAQLKMSYSHLSYDSPVYDKNNVITGISTLPFINKWISHEHDIRRKDDIDIYPNTTDCPPNIFNMWEPFAMEKMTGDYANKTYELEIILNHIKILCNHDSAVYDYFIKWIAQMIQYPHIKTIMPTFISGEGAGKGTLFKLFEKMLGDEKVFETTNPSRDVWGDFNSIMRNCFLVNLNELSKKDTLEADGKIKGLITDTSLTINQKGIDPYQIKSYHRFIVTTNKGEPLNSSKGDRRNLIIRSSDEKKGDSAYFQVVHSYLDDINVIRTCYDYFKSIPDMDKFKDIPLPQTEYQENLKELSRSPIELWLESWTREQSNNGIESVELLGSEVFELFIQWCSDNRIKYEVDSLKLGVRLTNMNISGIYKGTHCKNGKTKKFVISELKRAFEM